MGICIFARNNCNSHVYWQAEAVWANERPVSREPTFSLVSKVLGDTNVQAQCHLIFFRLIIETRASNENRIT